MGAIKNGKILNGVYINGKQASGLVKNGVVFWKRPFEAIFDTRLTEVGSTENNQVRLIFSASNFKPLKVDWGDGSSSEITTYNSILLTKSYAISGIYNVRVIGDSFSIYWYNQPESRKLIGIVKNGNNVFLANSFYGCRNNKSIGDDCDLLNMATNGSYMFWQNKLTTLPSGMTLNSLTTGTQMFYQNQLTTLPSGMTLNNLTVGNNMFQQNKLTTLPSGMTLNNLTIGNFMFHLNIISTTRYSQLLIDMNNFNTNTNVVFHGGNSKYNSSAIAARENLVNVKKWTITDSGLQT